MLLDPFLTLLHIKFQFRGPRDSDSTVALFRNLYDLSILTKVCSPHPFSFNIISSHFNLNKYN
ncbi:uncharacterized protein DS421_1g30080 [Arachis hypogaea]|nr:uncharacterized protein DS421_1g30080 [Arachis hypogaea]